VVGLLALPTAEASFLFEQGVYQSDKGHSSKFVHQIVLEYWHKSEAYA
jgi:hypothetical protein